MKTLILTITCSVIYMNSLFAQELAEITGVRIYEHHSSSINGGVEFGFGANGAQSGYDFVNNAYYNSFDPDTFSEYADGEEVNIDLVEHNGPFGGIGGDFGFTAGVSTIWGGEVKGNSMTKWILAPDDFNYDLVSDVGDLIEAYDTDAASLEVDYVEDGDVYIGQIRETNLYVVLQVYNVTNIGVEETGVLDVYFDFDYKYGTLCEIDASVTVADNILTASGDPELSYQWVDCNNDNAPITGETSQVFEPSENGSYAVEISSELCSIISDCFDITSLDILSPVYNSNILTYPNPVKELLVIELGQSELNEIMLVDMSGRIVLIKAANGDEVITLNLSNMLEGSYILTNKNHSFTRLIVKD